MDKSERSVLMCHKKTNEYTLCVNNDRFYLSALKRCGGGTVASTSLVMKTLEKARLCEARTLNTLCFLTGIDSQLCRPPSESMAKQLPTSPAERRCAAGSVPSVLLRRTFPAWLHQSFHHAGVNP